MKKRIGNYIIKKIPGESYKCYIPPLLPFTPKIDLGQFYTQLEKANLVLSELNQVSKFIPNVTLFIYMNVRKEALLSSQIEGTQSSFSDLILFENKQKTEIDIDDVREVSNYVKAMNHGLKRLASGFPLSLRLFKEIHKILLSGSRGGNKLAGEFRNSQNWIGGTRPGNALFVPPPPENLLDCLSNLERFIHEDGSPLLIKAAIAHLQFETIHPFLDGNGRLGRLLIGLLLVDGKIIDEPILYLSLYLKKNRQKYYDLLQEVRNRGNWEVWIEFFLQGIVESGKDAIKSAKDINNLFTKDLAKIANLGRVRFSCQMIFEYLKMLPQVTVPLVAKKLNMSAPTARSALVKMVEVGILKEISGKKRDRIYVYRKYLDILEEGC